MLAANFDFNDVHRKLIFQVQQAYYRLLNASAQDTAARASLANAEAVQQAAEERLTNGLATLPDVLEARSATAQSQYDLQAVLGAEEIASGDLATALGGSCRDCDSSRAAERATDSRSIGESSRGGDLSRSRAAAGPPGGPGRRPLGAGAAEGGAGCVLSELESES